MFQLTISRRVAREPRAIPIRSSAEIELDGRKPSTTLQMTGDRVDRFLEEFIQWTSDQSDILAVALVGSYARGTPNPSSDVDLVILTSRADSYLQNREWVSNFGLVANEEVEPYGPLTSLRVHYKDGLEIEYGLTGREWAAEPLDEGTREVISNGMKVLLEREPLLSRHSVILESRPTTG